MKPLHIALAALLALPFSQREVRAGQGPDVVSRAAGERLAARRAAALSRHSDDLGELQRLAELALEPGLSSPQRAVLVARARDRVHALDARAYGVGYAGVLPLSRAGLVLVADPAGDAPDRLVTFDLTARGLGLDALSLASPETAMDARNRLDRARVRVVQAGAADPAARH